MAAPNADKLGVMIAEAEKHSKAELQFEYSHAIALCWSKHDEPTQRGASTAKLAAAVSFVLMSTHEKAFVALVYMPMQPAL